VQGPHPGDATVNRPVQLLPRGKTSLLEQIVELEQEQDRLMDLDNRNSMTKSCRVDLKIPFLYENASGIFNLHACFTPGNHVNFTETLRESPVQPGRLPVLKCFRDNQFFLALKTLRI
jgi:hypothetical protein